ncbi:NADH dehydrogenase [ubiquinone] complex I, assembly factor 7 [Rhizophlyctis rosea]|uniref:Protein arginine methyltransferase NDUFAF7 n=1 Tax=Rhizophlyctis rosea TaxID=64517 RepID=A0AAD5SJ40_9FUNG|nr:NADH dehydrogenase [ubiquinone] complex I, assembly factor 7 [Rhizophlyctis rosea]
MVGLDESENSIKNFQFVLAPSTTPATDVLLMEIDPRYKSLKVGDRVEISPESYAITNQIAKRLHADGGAGLLIDYGRDEIPGDSLRGIRKHAFTDPLEQLGESDLSADVDFTILKKACIDLVQTSGPITQSMFLQSMGIGARANMLLQKANSEQRKDIAAAYERLVGPESMGTAYKFLALTPLDTDVPYPFQAGSGEKDSA